MVLSRKWLIGIGSAIVLVLGAGALLYFTGYIGADSKYGIVNGSLSPTTIDIGKGEKVDLKFSLRNRSNVAAYVNDANNQTVKKIYNSTAPLAAGTYDKTKIPTLVWDGNNDAGLLVAAGKYSIVFQAVNPKYPSIKVNDVEALTVKRTIASSTVTVSPSSFNPTTASASIKIGVSTNATYRLAVKDAAGTIVRTLADFAVVPVGNYTRNWDGKNSSGQLMADGVYTVQNEIKQSDGSVAVSGSAKVTLSGGGGTGSGSTSPTAIESGCTKVAAVGDIAASILAPAKANPGYTISLDATQSNGTNAFGENDQYGLVHYSWDFGDGSAIVNDQYSAMVSHSYASAGTYTAKLTVTDYACRTASTTKQITVANLTKVNVSGLTDEAVQAAVTSAGTYGIVYLPAGTYFFNRQVQLKEGIIIEGAGRDKTIITQPGSAGKAFTLSGDNTRITGVKISNSSADTEWPISIEMSVPTTRRAWKNIYVDNSEFTHLTQSINGTYSSAGTNLTGASLFFEKNVIHGNDYSGMGYGISSEMGSYLVAKSNELYTNRHSVEAGGKSGNSTTNYISYKTGYDLVGNTFHGPNSARCSNCVDVAVDMHMGGRGRLRIVNNTFKDIKYAIGLHDGWGEIKGNTFENVGYVNTSGSSYVIKLTKDMHNSFDGTKCVDAIDPNLTGRAVCKGAFNFNISGNTFTNNPAPLWYTLDYDAERPPQNVYINGCKVTSATYSGKGAKGEAGLQCP